MNQTAQSAGSWQRWLKLAVFVALLGAAVLVYYFLGDYLDLEVLAERKEDLRRYQAENPVMVFGLAFLVYVLVAGLSIPGATVLTLLFAWYFGFWPALILISFASTLGATIAFLSSRFLFRQALQSKFGERLKTFNEALEREGSYYLFSLRLIPAIPFFVINLVMGLTPVKTSTYWWVSQLGMLPGTVVYVFAGASVRNLETIAEDGPGNVLPLLIAFAFLGFFPLAAKWALNRYKGQKEIITEENEVD